MICFLPFSFNFKRSDSSMTHQLEHSCIHKHSKTDITPLQINLILTKIYTFTPDKYFCSITPPTPIKLSFQSELLL